MSKFGGILKDDANYSQYADLLWDIQSKTKYGSAWLSSGGLKSKIDAAVMSNAEAGEVWNIKLLKHSGFQILLFI